MQIENFDLLDMHWEKLNDASWNKYYSSALDYYGKYLALDPEASYVTEDGVRLGEWLAQLRIYRKNGVSSEHLTDERIAMLDKIGMLWDVYDYVFERNYHAAAEYYQKHGDLECAPGHVTSDGIRLGVWLQYLRTQHKKNRRFLTDEQYHMLDSIGMRWGTKYDLQWDEAYSELCEYHSKNKNVSVPVAYTTGSGLLLGRWIRRQIELYAKGQLRSDRSERLEALGIVWRSADPWEEQFRRAKAYSETQGDLNIFERNEDRCGKKLCAWVAKQRDHYRKGKLSEKQICLLREIGIELDSDDDHDR